MPIEWDMGAFNEGLAKSALTIQAHAEAKAGRFVATVITLAKANCPKGKGTHGPAKLVDTIMAEPGVSPLGPYWDVGTRDPVGVYQEFGTGIYGTGPGASGRPITPKNAKMLHWVDEGGGDVFAHSVKGSRPQPFLRPALIEAAALAWGGIA